MKRIPINPVARYYWQHARVYKRLLAGMLFWMPVTTITNNYLPTLVVATVLGMLSAHSYHGFSNFIPYLIIYAALVLTGLVLWRVVDKFIWRLEGNISRDIAEEVFDHLIHESADFHANNFTGSLVSHTNKLMGGYIRASDTTVFQVYPLLTGIVVSSIILSTRAPLFVIVFVGFALVFLSLSVFISRPVQRQGVIFAAAESQQTGYLADAVTNAMAVKSFARTDFERKRFRKATNNTYKNLFEFARKHSQQMNILGTLGRSTSAMSLTMVVVSVVLFRANIATAFLILSYTGSIVDQLFQFSNNSLRNYNRAFGDGADMVATLSKAPKIVDPKDPEPLRINHGDIVFDAVEFTHDGASHALFKNLDVHIKAGEKVGLVGHSGSGKTTFTRLLLRFSDIQGGAIRIDGQDIRAITQDDLHSKIAYVPQEPALFHRTLKENIGYGNMEASDAEIKKVARLAHAEEFIDALPDRYETLVGERGVKLSGGQRQRVAIARAMIKNAPILVLDEATAALDSESEGLIQDALWKLMEGRTAIVIAHRLSTIQKMDRIIVMDEGKVIEEGTHTELLALGGQYAALWARQSGGFIS